MQAGAHTNGNNEMMSSGHHLSCAHSFLSILSADVIRVMSAFSVLIKVIFIRIKKKYLIYRNTLMIRLSDFRII